MGCTAVPEELLPAHLRACRLPQMEYSEHYPASLGCSPHTAAQLPTCCSPGGSADLHDAGHYSGNCRPPAAAPSKLLRRSLSSAHTAAGHGSSSTEFPSPDRKAKHCVSQSARQVGLSAAGQPAVAVAPSECSNVAAAGRAAAADAAEPQASTGPPAGTPASLVPTSIHPSTSLEVKHSLAALGEDTAAAPSVADWHQLLERLAVQLQMWQSAADGTAVMGSGEERSDSPVGPVSPVPVDVQGTGSRSAAPPAAASECPPLRRQDVGAERQPAAAGASSRPADSHAQLLALLGQMEPLLKEGAAGRVAGQEDLLCVRCWAPEPLPRTLGGLQRRSWCWCCAPTPQQTSWSRCINAVLGGPDPTAAVSSVRNLERAAPLVSGTTYF